MSILAIVKIDNSVDSAFINNVLALKLSCETDRTIFQTEALKLFNRYKYATREVVESLRENSATLLKNV